MKSIWGFWTLVLVAVILMGVATAVGVSFAIQLGPDSKAFVDETVPKIVKSWDVQDLVDHASPDLLSAISRDELDKVFATSAKRLGHLKAYTGSWQESADVKLFDPRESHATFLYMTEAVFDGGGATIGVEVKKRYGIRALLGRDADWRVTSFTVRARTVLGGESKPAATPAPPAPAATKAPAEPSAPRPVPTDVKAGRAASPAPAPRPAATDVKTGTAGSSTPVLPSAPADAKPESPAPATAPTEAKPAIGDSPAPAARPAPADVKPGTSESSTPAPRPAPTDAKPDTGESSPAPARP